jgi:hypothetical protein
VETQPSETSSDKYRDSPRSGLIDNYYGPLTLVKDVRHDIKGIGTWSSSEHLKEHIQEAVQPTEWSIAQSATQPPSAHALHSQHTVLIQSTSPSTANTCFETAPCDQLEPHSSLSGTNVYKKGDKEQISMQMSDLIFAILHAKLDFPAYSRHCDSFFTRWEAIAQELKERKYVKRFVVCCKILIYILAQRYIPYTPKL